MIKIKVNPEVVSGRETRAVILVTNRSVRNGIPIPATFDIYVWSFIAGERFFPLTSFEGEYFRAEQTREFVVYFTPQKWMENLTGTISASVIQPETRETLAYATLEVKVIPPPGIKGDLDNDGRLTATDLTLLELLVVGLYTVDDIARMYGMTAEEVFWRADVNDDGRLDATDVTLLERLILIA